MDQSALLLLNGRCVALLYEEFLLGNYLNFGIRSILVSCKVTKILSRKVYSLLLSVKNF